MLNSVRLYTFSSIIFQTDFRTACLSHLRSARWEGRAAPDSPRHRCALGPRARPAVLAGRENRGEQVRARLRDAGVAGGRRPDGLWTLSPVLSDPVRGVLGPFPRRRPGARGRQRHRPRQAEPCPSAHVHSFIQSFNKHLGLWWGQAVPPPNTLMPSGVGMMVPLW